MNVARNEPTLLNHLTFRRIKKMLFGVNLSFGLFQGGVEQAGNA